MDNALFHAKSYHDKFDYLFNTVEALKQKYIDLTLDSTGSRKRVRQAESNSSTLSLPQENSQPFVDYAGRQPSDSSAPPDSESQGEGVHIVKVEDDADTLNRTYLLTDDMDDLQDIYVPKPHICVCANKEALDFYKNIPNILTVSAEDAYLEKNSYLFGTDANEVRACLGYHPKYYALDMLGLAMLHHTLSSATPYLNIMTKFLYEFFDDVDGANWNVGNGSIYSASGRELKTLMTAPFDSECNRMQHQPSSLLRALGLACYQNQDDTAEIADYINTHTDTEWKESFLQANDYNDLIEGCIKPNGTFDTKAAREMLISNAYSPVAAIQQHMGKHTYNEVFVAFYSLAGSWQFVTVGADEELEQILKDTGRYNGTLMSDEFDE